MTPRWQILDAIAREHWRLSDAAKRKGDEGGFMNHLTMAQAYDEAAGTCRADNPDADAGDGYVERALAENLAPAAVLAMMERT